MCTEFEKMMHKKFQISSMGELTFFLGLQVTQKDDGIFISQDKYVDEILKKFGFSTMRITSTPMETSKPLLKDAKAEDVDDSTFDLEAYSDSDYAGVSLDRKSTTGGCQFLGSRLISWQCKKQTIVSNSTTEVECVAAANCCGQVLRIQNQMLDYGYNFMNTKIFIDNESTISIVKNPLFHSKTKHTKIRHHFIRDSYEKRLIQVIKIHTDHNVADLLTKALDVSHETIHEEMRDSVERAATTAASLDAEQNSGDRPTQTRFKRLSKQSNDLPILRYNTLRSGEDNMKLNELMDLCTKLSDKVLDLENMKSEKSKAKGVTMQEPSKSGTRVRVPPPQIDPKDKGKAKMIEPKKPKKKRDQIEYDADVAQRLRAELDEEARLEREREKEASKAANIAEWDDVQAMMSRIMSWPTK
ncbi:putative ribonuclease H-like domain-containing protein [Tanacetum coccineum]|uniref:Ribonuclease H-like domain-containing protein n=1 Tax=Tanacetum coccineum TaxID=301880 RepID=A0ABQ5C855_9ASTR